MRVSSSLDADVETGQAILLLQPGYAFDTKILGGTPYLSIAGGYGVTTTRLEIDTPMGEQRPFADDFGRARPEPLRQPQLEQGYQQPDDLPVAQRAGGVLQS